MQKRLFGIFSFIIILTVLFMALMSNSLIRQSYMNGVEERLSSDARYISRLIEMEGGRLELMTEEFRSLSEDLGFRITLIAADGRVLYDSTEPAETLENHGGRPEVEIALAGQVGRSSRVSATIGQELLYVAVPNLTTDSDVAVIRLAVPLKSVDQYTRNLIQIVVGVALVGLAAALMLGYRWIVSLMRPIKELSSATKRIASGYYGEKIYTGTEDEFGELARSFNTMSDELKGKLEETSAQNTQMNAILSSVLNPVIAVDRELRILFINGSAKRIFGAEGLDPRGRFILDFVRSSSVQEALTALMKTNEPTVREIEMTAAGRDVYNVYANPIREFKEGGRSLGVVMIFQDITEIRKLEIMRKQFVANVSHELKTPLTSIKGFVETLRGGAVEDERVRDRFLEIVEVESSRLSELIDDLLVLTDIERRTEDGIYEPIDMKKTIGDVVLMLEDSAASKEIAIQSILPETLPTLHGNPNWFKQMLINLVDNAIKYTPGGGHVTVKVSFDMKEITISVRDNGIGIERDHLGRLFERFYRVDKARSRDVGGTGLGLAIVKHIVLSFGGAISVKSEPGKGSEFTVLLPRTDVGQRVL
ncbi:PAS/PAC sensor signal transduction histidine kinase [Acidaminobacter hydrogenoformans DSM 2784]|uniref:histidine kinase n=2 Tax=Acidaminobacter TaxID=65402 RepID=A0A1G5S559_9FIRM|nr:ATP-binding protein [Acidaminobacter hydrogenoformans]SCZ81532.1 PAS/PAC sensor signal transduction histidine kinase [Acidaminobacter hydrogenoformans DSM 2784]